MDRSGRDFDRRFEEFNFFEQEETLNAFGNNRVLFVIQTALDGPWSLEHFAVGNGPDLPARIPTTRRSITLDITDSVIGRPRFTLSWEVLYGQNQPVTAAFVVVNGQPVLIARKRNAVQGEVWRVFDAPFPPQP